MSIQLRAAAECKFDVAALGECMVRLAPPGHGRIEFARTLEVDVGGGEFNMAYACARLGLRASFLSKLPDNLVARIILNHARAAGMSVEHVVMEEYDGLGRQSRVGLNFTEVGTGVRPSLTLYDRGHSAASQMQPADLDWAKIFSEQGVRWLHCGGIFNSLSDSTAATVKTAFNAANAARAICSYDFNFRSKLWNPAKGVANAREIAPLAHVLIGSAEDLKSCLGMESKIDPAANRDAYVATFKSVADQVTKAYPNIKAICTTLREVKSGLINHWGGILWHDGQFFEAREFRNLEVEDRVGGGDGFSAGIAYGFLSGMPPQEIVDFAAAHGALLHTTRGDTSQVTLEETLHVMKGGGAGIQR